LVKFAVLQWFFAPQGTEKYAMGALSLAECVKRVVMGASNFKFGQNCHISSRRGNGIYRSRWNLMWKYVTGLWWSAKFHSTWWRVLV